MSQWKEPPDTPCDTLPQWKGLSLHGGVVAAEASDFNVMLSTAAVVRISFYHATARLNEA